MLKLPKQFKQQIINRYNDEGKDWLNNINNIIDKYKNKFQLDEMVLVEPLSINIVLFAKSKEYGNVVMKIGSPGKTSISEINMMKQYSKNLIPKCYYYNLGDRVMIQERLIPGYPLQNLKDRKERVKIFCNIVNHLIIVNNNEKCFQTYEDSIKENIEYAYNNKQMYDDIIWMIDKANNIYQHIRTMNLPQYVLHDDLQHKNILKSDNDWKVIDPHGIIGEKVFETSVFIRAELQNSDISINEFNKLILLIEKYLKEDKELILQALYITIILKIIWYIKVKYDETEILYNIDIANKILKLIKL